jgi:hypothetical protein
MDDPITTSRLYSADEVGALTGRTGVAVRALARRKKDIGRQVAGAWVFTDADIEKIRAIDPRGGAPTQDGAPPTYSANLDRIKNRGPKKKPAP